MAVQTQLLHAKGPFLSRIIAGAWRWHTVPADVLDRLIQTSVDVGITTFDHADIYGDHGNEKIFGDSLRRQSSLRDKIQVVTKCGIKFPSAHRPSTRVKHYDTSTEHIEWSAENSLMQLGVDKLDVLLIHRPDPLLDPEALAGAFIKLRDQGKVLHFGVSNFSRTQFDTLQSYLSFPLVTNQVEISLFLPQPVLDGTLDHLMQNRTSAMAWSPLGGGKFLTGENEASRRVLDGLIHFGPGYQASPSQLLLAWLLRHPSRIFPVIGTTKPERLAECSRAAEIQLDRQDWFEMLQLATGKEVA